MVTLSGKRKPEFSVITSRSPKPPICSGPVSQNSGRPARQLAHRPQKPRGSTATLSPGLSMVTARPTSMTVPAVSWPIRQPVL